MLRIYADFNSTSEDGWCWCLRYGDVPLDDVAESLALTDGMKVILYHSDPAEEFELDGVLCREVSEQGARWLARPDQTTYRLVRGDLEQQFWTKGVRHGGVLMLSPSVAHEFIDAARLAQRPILGVDCFVVTESSTMSPLEHILDLSRAEPSVDTWREARRFVEERSHLGFLFEIVV